MKKQKDERTGSDTPSTFNDEQQDAWQSGFSIRANNEHGTMPLLTNVHDQELVLLPTEKPSAVSRMLQKLLVKVLLPKAQNWYIANGYDQDRHGERVDDPFVQFVKTQTTNINAQFYQDFTNLDITRRHLATRNCAGDESFFDVVAFDPTRYLNTEQAQRSPKPGAGRHIIYICGANTYYQNCFPDISAAAKKTGATVHVFNYPGSDGVQGNLCEFNDLVNSGIAVVNALLDDGVHPDDMLLLGDSFGSSVAHGVKTQYKKQCDRDIRVVVNNTFKSFKAAIMDMIRTTKWLPNISDRSIKKLLERTGWDVRLGQQYQLSDPYQCFVQHNDDQTLQHSKLSYKIQKYREEAKTGQTTSTKRVAIVDTCPEEYKKQRDELDSLSIVQLSHAAKQRLAEKYGKNAVGLANSHYANLCECEMLDGEDVYEGLVNRYLQYSNEYINKYPQRLLGQSKRAIFLSSAVLQSSRSRPEDSDTRGKLSGEPHNN